MRFPVPLLLVACLAGCAAREQTCRGIVRRTSDKRPVAGVSVSAVAEPPPTLLGPMSHQFLGGTTTASDGTFRLVLTAFPNRLTMTVMARVGSVSIRKPSPKDLNIIEVSEAFDPKLKLRVQSTR